ncbi:MAG: hypothetical protein ACE5OR_12130 [bacterium]
MPIHSCEILANERLAGDIYRLKFYSEPIARGAQPGQFVHIRTSTQSDPLLPRPFSIHDVDRRANTTAILFKLVGAGGIGIAPFPFLVRRLLGKGSPVVVLAGWKRASTVVGIEEIESLGASVEVGCDREPYD